MTGAEVLVESLIDWGVVAAQAGASFCTAGVSPPSQSGCLAVESWCDVVLKISYFPVVAASLVFAKSRAICPRFIGWKVLTASNAWSSTSRLSIPVITTDVGRLDA